MIDVTFDDSFIATLSSTYESNPIGLSLNLDVGKLIPQDTLRTREELYHKYELVNQEGSAVGIIKQQLELLKAAIERGEDLRVWTLAGDAGDYCGLRWLSSQVKGTKVTLSVNEVSRERFFSDHVESLDKLGDLSLQDLKDFNLLKSGQQLTVAEINGYSLEWQHLSHNSQPLRALVNGNLLNLSANFYDQFIINGISTAGSQRVDKLLES